MLTSLCNQQAYIDLNTHGYIADPRIRMFTFDNELLQMTAGPTTEQPCSGYEPGPIVATYKSGQVIPITWTIFTAHGGTCSVELSINGKDSEFQEIKSYSNCADEIGTFNDTCADIKIEAENNKSTNTVPLTTTLSTPLTTTLSTPLTTTLPTLPILKTISLTSNTIMTPTSTKFPTRTSSTTKPKKSTCTPSITKPKKSTCTPSITKHKKSTCTPSITKPKKSTCTPSITKPKKSTCTPSIAKPKKSTCTPSIAKPKKSTCTSSIAAPTKNYKP
ncbi:1978_t:CDS:2, partial [Racocetra fulgida]